MEAGTSPELAFRLVGETVDWYQQWYKNTHKKDGSLLSAREQLRLGIQQARIALSTSCPKAEPAKPAAPEVTINNKAHLVVRATAVGVEAATASAGATAADTGVAAAGAGVTAAGACATAAGAGATPADAEATATGAGATATGAGLG